MEEGVIKEILKAKRMVALTGLGISAESGIPTFRGRGGLPSGGRDGGLWEKYNPSVYANIPGLSRALFTKPEKVMVTSIAGSA